MSAEVERSSTPTGRVLIKDMYRGIILIADPPSGRTCICCARPLCHWDALMGFQQAGTSQMQEAPYHVRLGLN